MTPAITINKISVNLWRTFPSCLVSSSPSKCSKNAPLYNSPLLILILLLSTLLSNIILHMRFEVQQHPIYCLLYTSDAADEEDSVDLGGRRIIKKKTNTKNRK